MDANQSEIVKLTTGPLLISTIIDWGLFGVLSLQVFLFSLAFPKDRWTVKAMVYGVYLLETAQTIVLTESAWATFVKGFGHDVSVSTFTTIAVSICFLGGATAMIAQTFYAYRIMIISQNKIIPSFIILMSLTSFISEIVVSVIIQRTKNFEIAQLHTLKTFDFIGIWIATSCACDIVIAGCMCFYLSRRMGDGLVPKTQALVSRAMRMTVDTGALTASVSIVSLAVFYAPTLNGFMYYAVPISALAKLHSNTMLALLNSRMKLEIISESTTWQENELPPIFLSHPRQISGIENMSFASASTSSNGMVDESKGEVIAMHAHEA